MLRVTLRFGMTRQITREVPQGTTVGQVLSAQNNRVLLGYGENVVAVSNGVTLNQNDLIEDGSTLVIEQQAAKKA